MIRNYIFVQIYSLWVSFLERRTNLDFFQLLVIILMEMGDFDPRELENGARIGNCSGYKATVKNNP